MTAAQTKDYELVIDYCAFMVAIILGRHAVTPENVNKQWSAEKLAASLNTIPYSDTPNLRVHALALTHGMQIFHKRISKRGHTAVPPLRLGKALQEYFTLKTSIRSTEIVFASMNNPSVTESVDSVMSRVLIIRNELLMKSTYNMSPHNSVSSVYAALYLPLITEMEEVRIPDDDENRPQKSQRAVRKSPSKLGKRAIRNHTRNIVADIESKYGKRDTIFYQEAVVNVSKKKRIREIRDGNEDEVEVEVEVEEKDDDCIEIEEKKAEVKPVLEHMNDERVSNALAAIPEKYITVSKEDQEIVTTLFAVVRAVAVEREHKFASKAAAIATVNILKGRNYYSQIPARSIMRWYDLKNGAKGGTSSSAHGSADAVEEGDGNDVQLEGCMQSHTA